MPVVMGPVSATEREHGLSWGWLSIVAALVKGKLRNSISHTLEQQKPLFLLSFTSPLGEAVFGSAAELLCSGTVKTGFAFPQSVLIRNEICKREALDEHLSMINVSLLS